MVDFARIVQDKGLNENGDYVILAAEKDEVYDHRSYEKFCGRVTDQVTEDSENKACRSLMILAPNYPKYDEFAAQVLRRSHDKPFQVPEYRGKGSVDIQVPIYAGLARDAILLLAEGMTKVMASDPEADPRNGTMVINAIRNIEYRSE